MMRLNFSRGAALAAAVGVSVLCLAGCGDRRADVAGPGQVAFRIQLRGAATGTTADAFARVDAAHVLVTQSATVLLDSTVAFGAADGTVTLLVRPTDQSATVAVALDLLRSGQALFRGGGSVELQRGKTTSLALTVSPVVSGVAGPDSVLLTAIGDTVRLRGAGLFATGDTVPGTPLTWAGDGVSVIRVSADGLVTAVAEGVGTATATYQTVAHATRVRVRVPVARVLLSPDTLSLAPRESGTVTAVARDRSGNVLQRTFSWRSSDPTVATVDGTGVVTGVGSGATAITATADGTSGSAIVQVAQPIVAVSPTQLTFAVAPGSAGGTQTATVSNAGDGTLRGLTTSVSYGAGASGWLGVSLGSGTAPTTLTLSANPGQLPQGSYTATVAVASTVPGAGSAQVAVTMAVQPLQPLIGVTATTVTMTAAFDSTQGYSAQDSSVIVYNAGGGTLDGLWASVSIPPRGCYLSSGWLSASVGQTAPTKLYLVAQGYPYGTPTCTASVTIGSTVPGTATKSVIVYYQSGGSIGSVPARRVVRP